MEVRIFIQPKGRLISVATVELATLEYQTASSKLINLRVNDRAVDIQSGTVFTNQGENPVED